MCPVNVRLLMSVLTVGLMADWVCEWVSEQLNPTQGASRWAREANVGVNREMWGLQLGTIGCIMDGEAEESERGPRWSGLRWARLGSEQGWAPAPASGDINAESHRYGGTLWTQLWPAGSRGQSACYQKKKERKGKKIKGKIESKPSIHPSTHASTSPCILPSLRKPTALCAALASWPDHCYSP